MKIAPLFFAAAFALLGQTSPTFDAASVKRLTPDTGTGLRSTGILPRQRDSSRIQYPGVSLKSVLAAAYKLEPDQIGGPQWLDEERYEILATPPAGVTQDQVPLMLRRLLADRFQLTAHVDSRPRTEYWLITGTSGPKLHPAKDPDSPGLEMKADHTSLQGMSLGGLSAFLASQMKRRVLDHTGIEGEFDIELNISSADLASGSVFSAVEDLGLKLETHRAPADYLVIDEISKTPTGN